MHSLGRHFFRHSAVLLHEVSINHCTYRCFFPCCPAKPLEILDPLVLSDHPHRRPQHLLAQRCVAGERFNYHFILNVTFRCVILLMVIWENSEKIRELQMMLNMGLAKFNDLRSNETLSLNPNIHLLLKFLRIC